MAMDQVAAPPAVRRKTRRNFGRIIGVTVTLAIAAGLGWWGWGKTHPADSATAKLLTDTVKKGDLIETVSATGSVTAQTGAQVKIGSQITGRIKHLNADVGSFVNKGQVIAELDLPDIEAQLHQAQGNLASAQTRLLQQQTGVGMQRTQTSSAVADAKAALLAAQKRLESVQAAANLQTAQTPNDIKRAESAVNVALAALGTAKSNQNQVKASVNLQVANAREDVNQTRATAQNALRNLNRQKELLSKGFVAQMVVDNAEQAYTVAQSQQTAAEQNVQLVKEKVAADLQSAQDQVTQAQQNVDAVRAALTSAQAGIYQDKAKLADVESARAQVRQAEAGLRTAQGNTTQDVLKQQDVKQAQEAIRVAQAQVDYNRAQLDKTYIRSPISGTVLQLASQEGETLAAGLSAPTLIIVADLKRLQVDVFVDETDIGKIKLGQEASVSVDAYSKKPFKGTVKKVASGSTIQQGVITYDVTVEIQDPRHQLKPDMTASVTIQTGKKEGVLLVPSESVKTGKNGSTVNVVAKKDGKTEVDPHRVKVGSSDGVNTEIREGLKEGDTIVLAGLDSGNRGFGPSSPFGPSQRSGGGGAGKGGGGGGGGRGGR